MVSWEEKGIMLVNFLLRGTIVNSTATMSYENRMLTFAQFVQQENVRSVSPSLQCQATQTVCTNEAIRKFATSILQS